MGKLFNLATGEQVYLEDCVIENEDLNECFSTPQKQYWKDEIEIIEKSTDIPKDINPVEFIEKDLDNQLDEPMLDSFMESVSITTPKVLPSYKDYGAWRVSQIEFCEYEAKVMMLGEELDRLLRERYQNEVVFPYRKELREWWFNRQKQFEGLNRDERPERYEEYGD